MESENLGNTLSLVVEDPEVTGYNERVGACQLGMGVNIGGRLCIEPHTIEGDGQKKLVGACVVPARNRAGKSTETRVEKSRMETVEIGIVGRILRAANAGECLAFAPADRLQSGKRAVQFQTASMKIRAQFFAGRCVGQRLFQVGQIDVRRRL